MGWCFMKKLNLKGKIFGELQAIDEDTSINKKGSYWICKCSCGKISTIRGTSITSSNTKSCGCLQKMALKKIQENNRKDISGQRFGKLVTTKEFIIKDKTTFWKCNCDCGNTTFVRIDSLTSGNTNSCGCLKSKGEMLIAEILQKLHLEYKQQYSFIDLINNKNNKLYFDFAIIKDEKIICLIEFQGIQHYQSQPLFGGEERFIQQQENDKIKEDYCNLHNIQLIKFSYKELKNIDTNYLKVKLISKGVWL